MPETTPRFQPKPELPTWVETKTSVAALVVVLMVAGAIAALLGSFGYAVYRIGQASASGSQSVIVVGQPLIGCLQTSVGCMDLGIAVTAANQVGLEELVAQNTFNELVPCSSVLICQQP